MKDPHSKARNDIAKHHNYTPTHVSAPAIVNFVGGCQSDLLSLFSNLEPKLMALSGNNNRGVYPCIVFCALYSTGERCSVRGALTSGDQLHENDRSQFWCNGSDMRRKILRQTRSSQLRWCPHSFRVGVCPATVYSYLDNIPLSHWAAVNLCFGKQR